MKLKAWRKEQSLTQVALAEKLCCSQTTISLIEADSGGERAGQIPDRGLMVRIYRETRGAVTPNDFYDLPDLDTAELPFDADEPGAAPLLEVAR